MNWFERLLRKYVEHKEIGWSEIGEKFTRYFLIKSRVGNVYLHQLNAPNWHPECHDHPWGFIAIILRRGYIERTRKQDVVFGRVVNSLIDTRKRPGTILFRPAAFLHNVRTEGTSWSLILTTPKSREWGFKPCERQGMGAGEALPYDKYRAIYKGSVNIRGLK